MDKSVVIIGAGIMGRGISLVFLRKEFEVYLVDPDENSRKSALSYHEKFLQRDTEKGRISQSKKEELLSKLTITSSLDELSTNPPVVIEAVPEILDLKKKILTSCEKIFRDAIFATNTSSIPISEIAEGSMSPDRVIGMHWFNPPPVKNLIEIIRTGATSDETYETVRSLAEELGKTIITVKDFPGFATSRLGVVIGLEAIRMVEQGVASPEDIDKAMELGYGHPMGPLKLTDLVGLDTRLHIARTIRDSGVSPAFEIPDLLVKMVEEGKLGQKTGKGFYDWD